MAKTAINQLQRHIDNVRREAFAAGYAAAMRAVRELASQSAPETGRQPGDAAGKRRAANRPQPHQLAGTVPGRARAQASADGPLAGGAAVMRK